MVTDAVAAGNDAALDEQRCLVARNPRDVIALHNLGVELRKRDRLDEALETLERAVALGAKAAETATVLAHLLADFGRFDEAVALYHHVLDVHPDMIDAHETLARLLPQIGRCDEAFDSYRQALLRAPGSGLLWLSALSAAKDLRDADQLLAWVADIEARFGPEPFLDVLAAQAHMWRGEDSIALHKLANVISTEPANPAVPATIAQTFLRNGDLFKAEAAALTATRLAPDDQTVGPC